MSAKTRVPAVDGWFTTGEAPRLIGSRGAETGSFFFPKNLASSRNPAAMRAEATERARSERQSLTQSPWAVVPAAPGPRAGVAELVARAGADARDAFGLIDARLVALSVQVEGLSRIVLALEGSVRDLCGSVREVLAELRAQQQRAAQPHPVAEALVFLIRGVANDGRGRLIVAGGFTALCAALAVVLLSWAAPAALADEEEDVRRDASGNPAAPQDLLALLRRAGTSEDLEGMSLPPNVESTRRS